VSSSTKARVLSIAFFAALLAVVVVVAATVEPAGAGAQPKRGAKSGGAGKQRRPIASPKPGEKIKRTNVRLVVRAGAEKEDLRAKLNGKSIGDRFGVNLKRHRRYLDASLVDGLRRGKNTLVVWVHRRHGGYRRSSVKFSVAHNRPMVSAGLDERLPVGSRIELHGQVQLAPVAKAAAATTEGEVAASGTEVEWSIVNAPPESELILPLATIEPADGQSAGIEEANTLSPIFAPDVPGAYELRMAVKGVGGTSADMVNVYVIPSTPLVVLNTEAKGGVGGNQPAIQVGENFLAAPAIETAGGGTQGYSGSTSDGTQFKALWQVVSLDRTTLGREWNRTYGLCKSQSAGSWSTCQISETGPTAGVPVAANLKEDLTKASVGELIVAASHAGGEWGSPTEGNFVENNLAPIGFPKESDPEIGAAITSSKPGELAGVGVSGLAQGEANIVAGAGRPGMTGYLSPSSDVERHYTFISSQRVPFDTRASESCANNTCTVAQQIGKGSGAVEVKGSVPADEGGFLVAGYNRLTLQPIESKVFITAVRGEEQEGNQGVPRASLEAIPGYLAGLANRGAIVLVTSIHGNQQQRKVLYQQGTPSWYKVLEGVASLGGAREELIKGIDTPGADYSLVGQAKQPEGTSASSSEPGARLRGFFVPDNDSIYRPEAISPKSKPSELLMEEVLRAPGKERWPGENEPEVMAAMAYIGTHGNTGLGERPRFSFWEKLKTAASAGEALSKVRELQEPTGQQGFSPAAFSRARKLLEEELPMVQTARSYMEMLATPAGGGKNAWQTAFKLSAELTELQTRMEAEAKANASIGQFLSQMLQLIFTATGQVEFTAPLKFAEEVATTSALGADIYNTLYDGREGKPGQQVKAAALAGELAKQAEQNEESFVRFGDILVSDWSKLQVVGTYGKCNPEGVGCGPNHEFEELGYDPQWVKQAKLSTEQAAERELYTQLVPLVFPIWKFEPALHFNATDLHNHYYCRDISYPLYRAPEMAYTRTLWSFLPNEESSGEPFYYQVYATIRRDGLTYGFPSKGLLEHMFNSVKSPDPSKRGLGMSPAEYMRQGERVAKYEPSSSCYWY
jgi:hypothetical protein